MKILLVEDEPGIISVIMRGLNQAGMDVSVAGDGLTGLDMFKSHDFDLIVLDLMLPGMGGIQVCREIRKQNDSIPIIMLTALSSTENVVTGLSSGADDYLAKPFKLAELEARIKSLLRRSQNGQKPRDIIHIGNIEIDKSAKVVSREGRPIGLTSTEYRLLEFFAENRGMVLSRIQILENVWDIDFNMGTNVVDVYVNYLRKKIDANQPVKLIHTVFGMGYLFKEELVNENTN